MRSNDDLQHLQHISDAIAQIQEFTLGLDLPAFESNRLMKLAVERLLQIITEAAHRLGREAPQVCPGVNWREVRGFGNTLRHEYDKLIARTVWETIVYDLPPLEKAVSEAIVRLQSENAGAPE